ncbi:MAG TPA: universal stress protein [Stellaceae bacterium]|jgi:nucleotide-binding universal stress UspA family protein|nr:universal stress protein [Stellaceae bacterium]
MSETSSSSSPPGEVPHARIFLVVVDKTEEMRVALRYAALRAFHTGGKLALLAVAAPPGIQQFAAIEERMEEEAREEAEALLAKLSAEVQDICGSTPSLYVRSGRPSEELLALIEEEPSISVLVLGAGTGQDGPGPLITALVSSAGKLRVPVTIVPGGLSEEQIAAVA